MLKLRTIRSISDRALPQRNGQFNTSFHRIQISPRLLRQAGFSSKAILADALISGRGSLVWARKNWSQFNALIRSHIFGLFVISFSTLQILPVTEAQAPKAAVKEPSTQAFAASVIANNAPTFQRPVKGGLSQTFWYVHPAIDIPNPYGAKIRPISEGKIVFAGWDGGFGYSVIIKHKAGFSSRYAHLSKVAVKKGVKVAKQTTIGYVGATGVATGSHLHLEVREEGELINPQKVLPAK